MAENEEQKAMRELEEVPAVEVITATAVHLMSAAALQVGLGESGYKGDLDEARKLINSLAGLITAAAADLGRPPRQTAERWLEISSISFPRSFNNQRCPWSRTRRKVHRSG